MSNRALNPQRDPRSAAEELVAAHQGEEEWLDAFAEHLDRQRSRESLLRVLAAWGLSQSEAARVLGVSRQAVGKWVEKGVPADRSPLIADLAAATDLLVRYLKRDRIPAVVRKPAPAFGDRSLLELLAHQGSPAVLEACRQMFDFGQVPG